MKKLFAMLLSVAIILSTITIPAYAETGSPTDNDVVFSVENVTAAPGTDVSVAFNIEGEYESHALTAFVRYDTNMLSVVGNGIVQGNIWQNMIAGGGTIVADAVTRPGQVPFMAIMPTNPFSGSGTIFTMNFHVNESVELGTVIPLELEIREFYYMPVQQTSPTLIPFTSDNGSITAQVYHSVTFVDCDGTVLSAQSVAHGSAAIEPTAPEHEGYAFIGWDKDFSNVTEDMTVTAQYSANSYSITYTINGEEYTAQTYEFGAAVSAPEYTVPEGHTFSGWNIPETMPAENLVLDAALTVNEYTVTYNINGEIYAIQVYAYGEEVFAPAYDVPDHFTFSGSSAGSAAKTKSAANIQTLLIFFHINTPLCLEGHTTHRSYLSLCWPSSARSQYRGLCFTSSNIRPIYSPMTPIKMSWNPLNRQSTIIVVVHPGTASPIILQ